ncbi:MAG: hypothetical protein K2P85_01975 [Flavobacteriaceae bacterium]|nr:hypothetical protein [Flavobacteriaceae bacterium]
MEEDIIDAIQNKNLIEIYYENQLQVVEPYCYGISKRGEEILKAYLIQGCQKELKTNWNNYYLDKANDLNVLKQTFIYVREDYARGDEEMYHIYAQL